MKKLIQVLSLAMCLGICQVGLSQESKTVDVANSTVTWTGGKIVGGDHSGTVQLTSGNLTFADGNYIGGSFVVDMTSLKNTDLSGEMAGKLEGHLKSDDFFGVDQHPTATVKITNIGQNRDSYTVTADVTIKGVTESVKFDASMNSQSANATIKLDRTKFGVKYGSSSFFDNLGDKAISNDFTLEVSLALEK